MIGLLVALYPRKWRAVFGEEFAALLEDTRLTPRAVSMSWFMRGSFMPEAIGG